MLMHCESLNAGPSHIGKDSPLSRFSPQSVVRSKTVIFLFFHQLKIPIKKPLRIFVLF